MKTTMIPTLLASLLTLSSLGTQPMQYFTNATAVAGMQHALAVVKDPAKYWPDMGPSPFLRGMLCAVDAV